MDRTEMTSSLCKLTSTNNGCRQDLVCYEGPNSETHQQLSNLHSSQYLPPRDVRPEMTQVRQFDGRCEHRVTGSTVSFHSLNYQVKVSATSRGCSTIDKQILHHISGIFRPGMNAIMGPTGSGKTTLLDVLAGRTEQYGINGYILVDGQRRPKNFKCMTGYVVQDDVVMGTLTVRENIMFSANLRLPQSVSHAEKCNRVTEALDELGLLKCADSKVGTEFIRGVSGGERKRCNIGMELIISPSILFLDEPTTGLDASTAFAVLSVLRRLSLRGRTIIFSIHQPRFAIFKLFDRLSLLAAGRTIYHGPATETLQFFSEMGYECEEHNNPADFFLDVINGDSSAVQCADVLMQQWETDGISVICSKSGTQNGPVAVLNIETQSSEEERGRTVAEQLSAKYSVSTWSHRCADELKPMLAEYLQKSVSGADKAVNGVQYATSFLVQLKYVSQRALLNMTRKPETSILQLVVSIFMALIIGIIYLQLDTLIPSIQSRQGLLFFVSMHNMMTNLPAIEVFIRERAIFRHENASGFYRVSSYFIAKVVCDLVPMRIIPLTAFAIIVYFMTGLQMDAGKFFLFFLDLFLVTLCGAATAFAVSTTVNVPAIGHMICVLIFTTMLIFGGLLVNIAALGDWIKWVQWLSITRYSLNTLLINEMKELQFSGGQTAKTCSNVSYIVLGSEFLDSQGIKHDTVWDKWQNVLALTLMAVGIMYIAYVQLRRMKKLK